MHNSDISVIIHRNILTEEVFMTDKLEHGENCTCGCQDGKDEDVKITLEFEDDEKVVVEPLFIFNLDGKDYIALVPEDKGSDDAEDEEDDVYLYIYHDLSDEEFEFLDIEDDEEFDKVCKEFERIIEEAQGTEE